MVCKIILRVILYNISNKVHCISIHLKCRYTKSKAAFNIKTFLMFPSACDNLNEAAYKTNDYEVGIVGNL